MENNALIVIDKVDPVEVFTNGGIEPVLDEIRNKATDFDPDTSTDEGRKEIASMAYKVSRSKTLLDDLGKALVADWKAKVKKVDGARKQIRDNLDALKTEVRQPLTEWEAEQERIRLEKIEAEEKRVAGIREKIESLNMYASPGMRSKAIQAIIDEVSAEEITEAHYHEFTEEAERVKQGTLAALNQSLEARKAWEEEQQKAKEEAERLEAERKKQEEEAAKLRAEQEALEAERRKIQEEKDRIERERKAEEERKAREEFKRKAKEEARIKAEQEAKEKAEREAREKEERERREAEERKRQEALRPEKERFKTWVQSFSENNPPIFKDSALSDLVCWVDDELDALINEAISKSEEL